MDYFTLHSEPSFFHDSFDIQPLVVKHHVKKELLDPRIDIYQSSNGTLTLVIEVPGVEKSDISIDVNDKDLVVRAQKKEINVITLEKEGEKDDTEEKNRKVIEDQKKIESQTIMPLKIESRDVMPKSQDGHYVQKQIMNGAFKKVFHLSPKHDSQNIKAKLSDGILKVVVPILKEVPKIHRINVE